MNCSIYSSSTRTEKFRKIRSRPSASEQIIFRLVNSIAMAKGGGFEPLLNSIRRRMEREKKTRNGCPLESEGPMKGERELAGCCRRDLEQLSLLYELVDRQRTEVTRELRASGGLPREEYPKFMADRESLMNWFAEQEARMISEYSEALSGFGTYEIDNKYASYRIARVLMLDLDDSTTPANVPSAFDGLVQKIQEKTDQGYGLSVATGKDLPYVLSLLDDPYRTGKLIELAKEAKAASENGDREKEEMIELEMVSLATRGHAGLLSDADSIRNRAGWQSLIDSLGERKKAEWLPTNIPIVCEAGCHVRTPDGNQFLTVFNGQTEFVPLDSLGSETESARKGAEQLRNLSDLKSELSSLFNGHGLLFVNTGPDGFKITKLQDAGELKWAGLPEDLVAPALEQLGSNNYFNVLLNGGNLFGESVEPRTGNGEHLQSLIERSTGSGGTVVIFDQTHRVASELLSEEGGFNRLKEMVLNKELGVTSDVQLIEEHGARGDVSGLLEKFREREIMVIPSPSVSHYEPNTVMYCPRPATYVDGDRITKSEEFMVRALHSATTAFIKEGGFNLECVSANHGLDVTPKGISKRVAIEALGREKPSQHKVVVYFGDSNNDISVMNVKNQPGFRSMTNSTVIPVAVCFKEKASGGAKLVPKQVIEISDAQVRDLSDVDLYEKIVEQKIAELRSGHETVRRVG